MSAQIIDGSAVAEQIRGEVAAEVRAIGFRRQITSRSGNSAGGGKPCITGVRKG